MATASRFADQQVGVDIADLSGGEIDPDGGLLALEVQAQLEALILGLELVGHEGARRGAHCGVQGRLIAAPAGAPVRRQYRQPAEVVRQPGTQPLEVELVQGKLQAPLGG
ncbi:hypothetical protein D3C72_851650 [compost metagenome]